MVEPCGAETLLIGGREKYYYFSLVLIDFFYNEKKSWNKPLENVKYGISE